MVSAVLTHRRRLGPALRSFAVPLLTALCVLGALASSGCAHGDAVATDDTNLLETLAHEGQFVSSFLAGKGWFEPALILGLSAVLWVGFRFLLARAEASGYDDLGRLGTVRIVGHSFILGLAVILMARFGFSVAPTISLALTLAVAGTGSLILVTRIRGAAAAFSMGSSGVVREGDELTVDGQVGVVERLGLLRIAMRRADGAMVLLPTRTLADATVTVRPRQYVAEITYVWVDHSSNEDRLLAEKRASGCPYRALARRPESRVTEQGVEVTLFVWGGRHVRAAEQWLVHAFAAAELTGGPVEGPRQADGSDAPGDMEEPD